MSEKIATVATDGGTTRRYAPQRPVEFVINLQCLLIVLFDRQADSIQGLVDGGEDVAAGAE